MRTDEREYRKGELMSLLGWTATEAEAAMREEETVDAAEVAVERERTACAELVRAAISSFEAGARAERRARKDDADGVWKDREVVALLNDLVLAIEARKGVIRG